MRLYVCRSQRPHGPIEHREGGFELFLRHKCETAYFVSVVPYRLILRLRIPTEHLQFHYFGSNFESVQATTNP